MGASGCVSCASKTYLRGGSRIRSLPHSPATTTRAAPSTTPLSFQFLSPGTSSIVRGNRPAVIEEQMQIFIQRL